MFGKVLGVIENMLVSFERLHEEKQTVNTKKIAPTTPKKSDTNSVFHQYIGCL